MTPFALLGTTDKGTPCTLDELAKLYEIKVLHDFKIKTKLQAILPTFSHYSTFISYLINNLSAIITAQPAELTSFIVDINQKFTLPTRYTRSKLFRAILHAFSYDVFRKSDLSSWLVERLGVKTCLYCNSAFIIVVKRNSPHKDTKALLQFDHYFPKSKHPYLSLSFFNLIPVCGNCNLLLGDRAKNNHPYLTKLDDIFSVRLSEDSLARCKLHMNELPVVCVDLKEASHRKVFDCLAIESRYAHFADIGKEIIWRQSIYTQDYLDDLRSRLKTESLSQDQVNRFILGNYCNPDDYHKRPLTKFYADIGKQLGLL